MNTKSVSIEEANAFMSSDNWPAAVCGRCGASLERGGGGVRYTGIVCGSAGIEGDILACTEAMKRERATKGYDHA